MFLQANYRDKDGKDHTYWSLVGTVRLPDGPCRRALCYLGELNDSAQARWLKVIDVYNEEGERRQLKLFPYKTKLEQHLKGRYGELFGAEFDVLLYDLTSTYVEGQAEKDPLLQRGYSRDHRPDCKQVVIALIVNAEGFPLGYETFDGNRTDVTTLETVMRMVERKYRWARPG